MPTINHVDLPTSELHSPVVTGFTGAPGSFVPSVSGVIVVATDTNFIYRTTGTSAGNVTQIGGGDATVLETFTGDPSAFSPSAADIFAIRTDLTPNVLYRTTGTGAGNVTLVGPIILTAGTGTPVSNITPAYAGQTFTQNDSDRRVNWISTGVTNTDWIAISGTAVQALADPAETPAFTGQQWHVVTTATVSPFVTLVRLWVGLDPTGNADTSSWYQLV